MENSARVDGQEYVLAVKDMSDLLKGLGHVEAHVGHLVVGHLEDHRQHLLGGDVLTARLRQGLQDTSTIIHQIGHTVKIK